MKEWFKRLDIFSPPAIRLLFWLAGAMFFLGLFAKLTKDVFEHDDVEKIDKAILLLAEKIRVTSFNGAAVDLTALGSPTVITIVSLIGLLILWLRKDRSGVVNLFVASVGAGFWTFTLKHLIARERPQIIPRLVEVSGLSYPSGHSLAAATVYLCLTFLACRYFESVRSRLILILASMCLIGAISLSRVYLGVHYPSDVASGVFLGASWALFLTAYFSSRYWRKVD